MSSDLIIHVVGAKADLAATSRAVPLEYARQCIRQWVTSPELPTPPLPSSSSSAASTSGSSSSRPAPPRINSAAHALTRISTADAAAISATSSKLSLGWSKSRRGTDDDRLTRTVAVPDDTSWCDVEVTEVSAKDDYGKLVFPSKDIFVRAQHDSTCLTQGSKTSFSISLADWLVDRLKSNVKDWLERATP